MVMFSFENNHNLFVDFDLGLKVHSLTLTNENTRWCNKKKTEKFGTAYFEGAKNIVP
jgi:hypothetical protein